MRNMSVIAFVSGTLVSVSGAAAQLSPAPDRAERPTDPYLPAPPSIFSVPASMFFPDAFPPSVQVNTNAGGLNITGDAANEPSIAVDPTNPLRMAVGWRQFDTIASNFRQAGRAYTTNGGLTWTNLPPLEPGIFRSDPVLEADHTGRFFYNSLTTSPSFTTQVFRSTDGGVTFPSKFSAFGGDKAWMVIDKSASTGRGFLYQAWSTAAGCCGASIFTRSTNAGQTWLTPIGLPGSPVWGTLSFNSDGDLFIVGAADFGSDFRVLKSTNARNAAVTPTFSSASLTLDGSLIFGVTDGPNPGGLLGQTWIDVDRSTGPRAGWVYVLASVQPFTSGDPLDVMFARSTNGGVTWSTPVRVNNDPAGAGRWQWFGTMSVAPNGRIDAVWYDTRNSLVARRSQVFYAFSTDGGTSWQGNIAITPEFDSWLGWPNQSKLGDYIDMESDLVGVDLIYAATFNGEQDVYYVRIGERDCNKNGQGDTTEIATGQARDCNANGIPDTCEGLPACRVDFNNDCEVDFSDIELFLAFYTGGNIAKADFNGDGELDFSDIEVFIGEYNAGC